MIRVLTLALALMTVSVWDVAAQDRLQSLVTLYVTTSENRIKIGTGFLVDQGIVVTAYHVVYGGHSIEVVRGTGTVARAVTIRNIFPERDLALMEVSDLSNGPALSVQDRIPPVDEDLFMLGSAAGIPNSTYTARVVQAKLVQIGTFNDTSGHALFNKPPATEVLQIASIVYGGLSGGPLTDRRGNVLGVLSGSLSEGGAYGWVIPSRDLQEALTRPPAQQKIEDISTWPPIPFRSSLLRSTEYFVRQDASIQNDFNNFTSQANRLDAINSSIEIRAGTFATNLAQDASSIGVMLTTPRIAGLGPVTPADINSSFMVSSRSMFFASNWLGLKNFRKSLADRYTADRSLRSLVSRLGEVADRPRLDPGSATKIRQAAQRIAASDAQIASDTFEQQHDLDTQSLLNALDKVLARKAFTFATIDDAKQYVDALQTSAELLKTYDVSGPFGSWVPQEKRYFEDAAKFLRRFQPVLVYVPE